MSIVLKHQVEASEKSAADLVAEFRQQHRRAMLCYDVQDLLRNVIDLHADLNRDVERWQNALSSQGPPEVAEIRQMGPEWEVLYRRLAPLFREVEGLIRCVEATGFEPEGKVEFFTSWKDLRSVVSFSYDEVATAMEQIRRGEVRTLAEVKAEL